MKKLALILLLSVFSITMFAQEQDTTEYVTDTNTEKLVDKYTSQFEGAIVALGEKLEQPASHVYETLVYQQVVYAWSSLGLCIIAILGIIIGFLIMKHSNYAEDAGSFIAILSGLILIGGLIWFLTDGITGFINPEYGAMKDVAKFVTSK